MTPAQEALAEFISDIDRFVSHNTGNMSGATTALETSLLQTAKTAALLRGALKGQAGIPDALDNFEGAFNTLTVLSHSVLHGALVGKISDAEINLMHEKIDAVRVEMES